MRASKLAAPPHNRGGNHTPSSETRILVDYLASVNVPVHIICRVFGITLLELHKLYKEELAFGGGWARAHIAKNAFRIAMDSRNPREAADMTKFLCRSVLGWSERNEHVMMKPDGSAADVQTVVILPANGREIPMIEPPEYGKPRKDVN